VTVLIRSGERDIDPVHLTEKRPNLADREAAGIPGDDLVVESSEAAFVLADQAWLERARPIARTSRANGPSSVSTVFPLVPLR
jgi:hypothetical protein